jgi:FG-GAP repeat/IPT/TIG domain
VRSGTTWEQQGPKLTGSEGSGEGYFGQSVALSGDGNTALIGAPTDAGKGAAWVFVRSQGSWTQQGQKLTAERTVAQSIGYRVALSADGNTALLGAYAPGNGDWGGTALVFTRSGEAWTQQGPALKSSEVSGEYLSGWSVALSADGNTALVGDVGENDLVGAAWVFTRSGSSWTQSARLTPSDESGAEGFGQSVALSGTGDTALVGGPGYKGSRGGAWVFRLSGASWSQQGPKLTDSAEITPEESQFGVGVALSADGQTALVGDINADSAFGAAFAFVEIEPAPPTVTSVSPSEGREAGGTSVTIAGTNFGETTAVDFGSHPATSFTVNSASSITATAPAGTGTVDVTVTTLQGTSPTSPSDRFTYVPTGPPPTVKKVSPGKGAAGGGTSVTITGIDFTGASAVKFGSINAASFVVKSATSITAVSPAGVAKAVDVTVTSPNGTGSVSSLDHFRFGPPTVTGVSPNTGPEAGSASVTVSGTGFGLGTEATAFKFGSTEVTTVDCTSTTTCVVAAPSHVAGSVEVKATVSGMTSPANSPADAFTYG